MYVLTKDYKVIDAWELGGLDYIKYAPTIEELCDEFVQIQKCYELPNKHWILPKVEDKPTETMLKGIKYHLKDGEIYGAIWTNKGLIYVAKLNEKGELKLLSEVQS